MPGPSPNHVSSSSSPSVVAGLRHADRVGLVKNIKHKRTRPYRPQTNGKIERFHRTLADGWAYARCYTSEAERRGELDGWLHYYNHHRPHTACGNQPPFSRLTGIEAKSTARRP